MFAVVKKDFIGFFTSLLGIGIMVVLFISMGLFTWVLEGNILDFGFSEMSVFFDMIPWLLLLFIPALSMRLFAEEMENKSIDLLRILPISTERIVFSKLLAAFFVVAVILLPTLIYVFSIKQLAVNHSIDFSIVWGQYIALILLSITFIQLATLASLFTNRQSLAFVVGLVINYLAWEGMLQVKPLFPNWLDVDFLSLKVHFANLSQGLIRVSDLFFFFGLNLLLYFFEVNKLKKAL